MKNIDGVIITEKMSKAGREFSAALYNRMAEKAITGEYEDDGNYKFRGIVDGCLKDELTPTEAMFLVMELSRDERKLTWHKRIGQQFYAIPVVVSRVEWDEVSTGDTVFIAGDLDERGIPHAVYGRHTVVDPERRILKNRQGTEFPERFNYLFVEVTV